MATIIGSRVAPTRIKDYVDPDDVENFGVDYANEMDTGEAVASASVEATAAMGSGATSDLNISTAAIESDKVSVQVSGWVPGATYTITYTAVTDATAPRTLERSIIVTCEQQ